MAFYVICDDDSKHEGMTKEQILEAIAQAIETGKIGNCDTGFVTKLKEMNSGSAVTIWVGTQAQYNAIENKAQNCLYIITDDTTGADIEKAIAAAVKKAEAALMAASGYDFTSSISISPDTVDEGLEGEPDGDGLKISEISPELFVYNPGTGIVHFGIYASVYGKMAKFAPFELFVNGNDYPPIFKGGMNAYPIVSNNPLFSAEWNELGITLTASQDFDTSNADEFDNEVVGVYLSGWYFAGKNLVEVNENGI